MSLFQRLFYQQKHKEKNSDDRSIYRVLAPCVISIFICAVCLCGASWAWFTASTSTGTTAIQSSSYKLSYQIDSDTTELAEADNTYTLTADAAVITLKATGTAGATGYCCIKIGDKTYCTGQIFVGGTFTFTVNAAAETTITLTPKWGTYSGTDDKNIISDNGSIGTASDALSLIAQTDGNEESKEEPKPEEENTTPEPSATTPATTQPETADTTAKTQEETAAAETEEPADTELTGEPIENENAAGAAEAAEAGET